MAGTRTPQDAMTARRLARLLCTALAAAALVPAAASAAEVWPALATEKVFPDSTRPLTGGDAVDLVAARGEKEGGQVAVRTDAALTVTPTVGDLTGPGTIPASRVSVFRVGYVTLTKPSAGIGPLHGDGRYADPLIPVDGPVSLPGGETTPFYVLVDVPGDAPAGTYTGTVDLGAAGSVPLRVTVAPLTASADRYPIVSRLHVGNLARALGVEEDDPAFVAGVYNDLLPMLRAHGVSPGRAPMTTPKVDAATGALDFANTLYGSRIRRDDNLNAFLGMGFPRIEVPFLPNMPTYGGNEDRDYRDAARRTATARSISQRYAGVIGSTYSLVVDEPSPKEYPVVRRAAAQLRSASPSVPVLVTEAPSREAVRAIGSAVDIWAPPLWDLFIDPAATQRVTTQGKQLWWYTYGSDTQRYTPNVLIDKATTEPRVLGWLAQRQGVQAFYYWGLNNWGGKQFQSPNQNAWYLSHTKSDVRCGGGTRDVGGNGEASLIWPGPSAAHPAYGSLRLEALRDGAEDYDLLSQLQRANPAYYTQVMDGLARPYTGTTDGDQGDACSEFARPGYLPVVETDPTAIDAARRGVIATLSGTPLATISGRITDAGATAASRTVHAAQTGGSPVHGAVVRFGTRETTTDQNGRWQLTGLPAVPGTLTVSRDPEGSVDAVSTEVTRDVLAAGGGTIATPPLPTSAGRAVLGKDLLPFRSMMAPARVRTQGGGIVMTLANSYDGGGSSRFAAGGATPSVQATYRRGAAGKAARNWSAYRYLDMTVQVTRNSKPGQRWYLIVTPGGDFRNSRNLSIGRPVQNIRLDLRRAHPTKGPVRGMTDVRYLRFGLQSALPKRWRDGQAPTVTLRISNMRLVR